jgi:hypothetical protein
LAFQRLNRTLRLTIALEAKLRAERARGFAAAQVGARGAATRGRADAAADEDEPLLSPEMRAKVNARLMQLVMRKRVIVGVVQDVLASDGADAETLEDVGRLLSERLLDREPSDTVEYPIGRMVARICRDLRVSPDWSRWKDCDWAVEEARTRAQGSPYGDPEIEPLGWRGGVAIPHADAGTLERLARGFAEDAGDDGFSSG